MKLIRDDSHQNQDESTYSNRELGESLVVRPLRERKNIDDVCIYDRTCHRDFVRERLDTDCLEEEDISFEKMCESK